MKIDLRRHGTAYLVPAIVAAITILGALTSSPDEPPPAQAAVSPVLATVVILGTSCFALWATFAALDRSRRPRHPALELVVGSVVVWAAAVLAISLMVARPPFTEVVGQSTFGLVLTCIWIVAVRYPRAVLAAVEVRRLHDAAQIAELRARLQPHFLLNSLNTIAERFGDDPGRARELIARLGDLLRTTLVCDTGHRPLADELAWLRGYAALLVARYDGDLEIVWHVDPEMLDLEVPPLLIQPLLENAVMHGAAPRDVRITITRRADALWLEVVGGVPHQRGSKGSGIGLDLVRRRLALLSSRAALDLTVTDTRSHATVRIPLRDLSRTRRTSGEPDLTIPR